MIQEALEYIKSFEKKINLIDVGDRKYSSENMIPIKKTYDVLKVASLIGLVETIKEYDKDVHFIHIEDYKTVSVKFRRQDEWGVTHKLVECSANPFIAGMDLVGLDTEKFSIALLTKFEQTPMRDELLKVCGSTTNTNDATIMDDGVTQKATTGKAIKSTVTIKNPVFLQPYRSFPEIDQPIEPFVFRIGEGRSEVSFSLHAGEACRWKLECILKIKEFLISQDVDLKIVY